MLLAAPGLRHDDPFTLQLQTLRRIGTLERESPCRASIAEPETEVKTVVEQLRQMGIDCDLQRLTENDLLASQQDRALRLARDLSMMMEYDESLLVQSLVEMEAQRRAGRQATRRAIAAVARYRKTIHRLVKILASAEARRAILREEPHDPGHD